MFVNVSKKKHTTTATSNIRKITIVPPLNKQREIVPAEKKRKLTKLKLIPLSDRRQTSKDRLRMIPIQWEISGGNSKLNPLLFIFVVHEPTRSPFIRKRKSISDIWYEKRKNIHQPTVKRSQHSTKFVSKISKQIKPNERCIPSRKNLNL